jgi:hypothetical protein
MNTEDLAVPRNRTRVKRIIVSALRRHPRPRPWRPHVRDRSVIQ